MKPPEAFGVVVRTVGLVVVLIAINAIIFALAEPGSLFLGIPLLLAGLWLLRGAAPLVSFAYPKE